MSQKILDEDGIAQNLTDAGCSKEFIQRFMHSRKTGAAVEQLSLLACHRRRLLADIHAQQKKLDCLDYLRHQLQQETKNINRKEETL